jgi:hypothetical protein
VSSALAQFFFYCFFFFYLLEVPVVHEVIANNAEIILQHKETVSEYDKLLFVVEFEFPLNLTFPTNLMAK